MDSLKHPQGKSIATSVPSFAIRFNAEDEELEEIYPSAEESDDEGEKQEDDPSSTGSTPVAVPPTELSTMTTAPSRDPSPMKEYLKGLGKRSTSMDAGIIDVGTTSDTWRIFHELRGKITKTVEEKFSEMKSDRKVFSGGSDQSKSCKLGVVGKSKDNSSISDSEDISETSNKVAVEPKVAIPKMEEFSPKKSIGDKEVKKQSVSLEEQEKDDMFNDSITDPPSTSSAHDISETAEVSPTLSKRETFRTKMKHNLSGLRHRHKNSLNKGVLTGGVTMSSLSDTGQDTVELGDSEVESGIEVSEETFLLSEQPDLSLIDPNVPTIDYRTEVPTSHPSLDAKRHRARHARSVMTRLWVYKYFIIIVIGFLIPLFFSISPYAIGFFCGAVFIALIFAIRDFFTRLVTPKCELPNKQPSSAAFTVPDYSAMPILEVPSVKEYQPLTKYEGWMNEYPETYEPETYTINETLSVYVRLEGSTLRISHTRVKIPKRAMWNERKHRLRFSHQRIYTIANCAVKLLPEGLNRRRLWSKKYPICIVLQKFSKYGVDYLKDETLDDEPDPSSETSLLEGNEDLDSRSDHSESISGGFMPESKNAKGDLETEPSKLKQDSVAESKPVADEEEQNTQEDLSDEDTFCHIDKTALEETCLYLFARTDREKEDWYRRFVMAVKFIGSDQEVPSISPPPPKVQATLETTTELQQDVAETEESLLVTTEPDDADADYVKFMSRFQPQVQMTKPSRPSKPPNSRDKTRNQEKIEEQIHSAVDKEVSSDVMWINALVGRVLFDILKNPEWVLKIQERIQKKLAAIKLPYFMEELLVTELEMGRTVPLIHRTSPPIVDERGLWVDLDVTYEGMVCLTLETKLNLMKLKRVGGEVAAAVTSVKEAPTTVDKRGSPMFDSDIDDSAESSDDDSELNKTSSEEDIAASSSAAGSGNTGKKILRMVNKIAASKYFQHATEYKYIKRAMEEVSNTRIILSVELKGLVGTLAVNIPPYPSDRLWYGFRGNPRLWLSARPKFGERRVNISHVISWIEKKLIQEFQKKFVLPNLDDLVIPPMTTNLPI